jgi:predicted Zn-dependent protease
VVNIEELNAFAVPGCFLHVNRGLVEAADNLSELAGVVGREIGHVEARHSVDVIERVQTAHRLTEDRIAHVQSLMRELPSESKSLQVSRPRSMRSLHGSPSYHRRHPSSGVARAMDRRGS